jgi:hypothetical protein
VDRIQAPLSRYVAPVLLTADLIDHWVRRQVIEFLVAQEMEGRRDPCIRQHAKEHERAALESELSAL